MARNESWEPRSARHVYPPHVGQMRHSDLHGLRSMSCTGRRRQVADVTADRRPTKSQSARSSLIIRFGRRAL